MGRSADSSVFPVNLSIVGLSELIPDEQTARAWLEAVRWPTGERQCPHCGSMRTSVNRSGRPMPYRCRQKGCHKFFSVRVGTVMEASRLPLRTWIFAMYLMSRSPKGCSSIQLGKDLGITQKSAWHVGQRIRAAWAEELDALAGTVEVDETYIGGKERNKHAKKRRYTRGPSGKQKIIGAVERGGNVRALHVDRLNAATLHGFIHGSARSGTTVYTDENPGYAGLRGFRHSSVNHKAKQYVEDDVHTNSVESFWALLKRGYVGTYHYWSPKHLQRYVDEFAGRANSRDLPQIDRMARLVRGSVGKRLRYKDLIASPPRKRLI